MARLMWVLLLLLAPGAIAGTPTEGTTEPLPVEGEAYEVERRDESAPRHATLRFLGENRDFFRARLDELRVRLDENWTGTARVLDPAWLDMLAAIAAARDSVAASQAGLSDDDLLASVGALLELEREMDLMDELLDAQESRLARLEEDFVGRQRTALVVLLRGIPSSGAPTTAVLRDADGRGHRIELPDVVIAALQRGGTAELVHRLVEPRAQTWSLSLERPGASPSVFDLPMEPERDRMTFVEIDASLADAAVRADADPAAGSGNPAALTWWVR